ANSVTRRPVGPPEIVKLIEQAGQPVARLFRVEEGDSARADDPEAASPVMVEQGRPFEGHRHRTGRGPGRGRAPQSGELPPREGIYAVERARKLTAEEADMSGKRVRA